MNRLITNLLLLAGATATIAAQLHRYWKRLPVLVIVFDNKLDNELTGNYSDSKRLLKNLKVPWFRVRLIKIRINDQHQPLDCPAAVTKIHSWTPFVMLLPPEEWAKAEKDNNYKFQNIKVYHGLYNSKSMKYDRNWIDGTVNVWLTNALLYQIHGREEINNTSINQFPTGKLGFCPLPESLVKELAAHPGGILEMCSGNGMPKC